MTTPPNDVPEQPAGDRVVMVLLLSAVAAFVLMLIWLVVR